jgi:hypothetical protein
MKIKERYLWIIFILLIIGVVLLFSCEKHQDCYVCTVKTQWFHGDYVVTSERDYPYCDVDKHWIEDFEKINTYSDTLTKMVQTVKCK